jgi:integrase
MPPLTDLKIRSHPLDRARVVRLWDTDGLHLECRPNGSRLWLFRYQRDGRRRRMSLGAYPLVSVKLARERRNDARRLLDSGVDPLTHRQQARQARLQDAEATVERVTRDWLALQVSEWTTGFYADTVAMFERYLFRPLGARPIRSVTAGDLWDEVFQPMTANGTRLEAARRLRQKCEAVWNYAIVRRLASSNEPAALKGQLRRHRGNHYDAVPLADLPRLLAAVRAYGNVYVEACVWLQLFTAARPGEARAAHRAEFDLDGAVWRVPAHRMKKRKEHKVPLSRQAVHLLRRLGQVALDADVLFPSRSRPGVPMSDMAVLQVFRRSGFADVTAHGMRALFSTTANDEAAASPQVIEAALAHVLGETKSKTEAAYNRATHFDARTVLMQWWADRVETLCREYTERTHLAPLFPPLGPLA